MPSKAEKLLQSMRKSKQGWKRTDLISLYTGFGFIITTSRGPHDKVTHPEFRQLIAFLPRHRTLANAYVDHAIRLVDRLNALKKTNEEMENPDGE